MAKACRWCGAELPDKGPTKCKDCQYMMSDYKRLAARVRRSSPLELKFEYLKLLRKMKYTLHPGEDLPYDLDYQIERVNRYLEGK